MKTKKLIYWLLPIVALMLQIGIFSIIDLVLKNDDPGPVPPVLGYILMSILVVFVALVGYIITYLYRKLRYKSIILVYGILFFFSLEVLVDSNTVINYDYTTKGAVWDVIINCMKGIFVWNSYPVILSILLHWYSKRIVYPED